MSVAGWAIGLAAFGAALLVENAILRRPPERPSPRAAVGRFLVFGWLFVSWLALWGEPWRAAFGTLCTVGVMAGLSVGKRAVLGEPLAFSDFGLLPLILRFPRLYLLEGFRLWVFWAVVVGCVGLVASTQPAAPFLGSAARIAILLGSGTLVALLPRFAAHRAVANALRAGMPEHDGEGSIRRHGLLLSLVLGWLRWAGDAARPYGPAAPHEGPDRPLDCDLVVAVQLESFLDPVRAFGDPDPLRQLDRARGRALAYGPLAVPAYGAFTMRTEHAVLTGLSDRDLGFLRLDPYLSRSGPAPATLASRLGAAGWRTLFMHPFPARFFGRHKVVPRLGFAETLFGEAFRDCPRVGPYVSDKAFAERIVAEAATSSGPTLIVAVTMENHGPFSPHRGIGILEDRAQHAFHLRHTDEAIGILVDGLAALPRRTLLCLWGDHPPILRDFPAGPPPVTDYVVLHLGHDVPSAGPGAARPMSADALGRLMGRLVTPAAAGTSA